MTPPELERIDALDGLRGVLAGAVVLSHTATLTYLPPSVHVPSPLEYLGWHLGAPAVDVFFVLSGYVVTRAFDTRRGPYLTFLWRRARRLLPLAWLAAALGLLVIRPLAALPHAGLDLGILAQLRQPLTTQNLTGLWTLGLNGSFRAAVINPPLWTLGTELFASALTPLLLTLARRWRWAALIAVGLTCFIFGYGLYFPALLLPMFMLGALLHAHPVTLPRGAAVLTGVAGAALLLSRTVLGDQPDEFRYLTAFGAAGVILAAQQLTPRVLTSRAALWLGTRSYALYATHFAGLLAGAALLPQAPVLGAAVIGWPLSLLLAHGAHVLTARVSGVRVPDRPRVTYRTAEGAAPSRGRTN